MPRATALAHLWLRPVVGLGIAAFVLFPWVHAVAPPSILPRDSALELLPTLVARLGLYYTAVFLEIFVHEAGHWFFGRLVGIRISDFVVGAASRPLRFTWRGKQFSFGWWLNGGYVVEIPARGNLAFGKQFVFLSGGMIGVVLVVGALFLVPVEEFGLDPVRNTFAALRRSLLVAGVIGVIASAFPREYRSGGALIPNDGLRIRQAWQWRGREDAHWREHLRLEELARRTEVGDYAGAATVLRALLKTDPNNRDRRELLVAYEGLAKSSGEARREHRAKIEQTVPGSVERAGAVDAAATEALLWGDHAELTWLRPLVEQAVDGFRWPTLFGTLGAILVELGETAKGAEALHECVRQTDSNMDRAIATAYLAKAAVRSGEPTRARELLDEAQKFGVDSSLVGKLVELLEVELSA